MLRRRFGRTELQMPVFSCGGMRYQQAWKDMPLSEVTADNQANLEATIRRSIEVGVNHIETARGYGSSERQLGVILPQFPRNQIIVQTKIVPEQDASTFRSFFLESLQRLNLEYVDLLSVHGINNEETLHWATRKGGALEVGRQLQSEGLARHIGFSTHAPPDMLMKVVQTDIHGGFDYVNLHWYYIYQKNWPALLEARRRDMGIFIISPSDKGGMLYKAPERLTKLTAPLHPIVFNDLFCLLRPEVHTLSLGAARPSDFDLHLEAIALYDRAAEVIPPIVARLDAALEDAMGRDFLAACEEFLPDWQDLPGHVNVRTILWLYSLVQAYDLVEYAKMRYNLLGSGGHWFPGLSAHGVDLAELRRALGRVPNLDRVMKIVEDADGLLYKEPVKRLSQS